MATLNIGGQCVTVDDSFLSLSPQARQQTVDEIYKDLQSSVAPSQQDVSAPQRSGSLQAFRTRYPQYNDMPDDQLADSLHRKFYSDMPARPRAELPL